MKIAVFSKKRAGFTDYLDRVAGERGHSVHVFDLDNLQVGENLLAYDLAVLKTKQLFFLYAGFYAQAHGVPVVPDPEVTRQVSNRLEFPFLARRAGIPTPKFLVGFPGVLEEQLRDDDFPLVLKRIVGGGSRNVTLVRSTCDIPPTRDRFLYLEEFLEGEHLLVYYVGGEVKCFEKKPFTNEHAPVKEVGVDDDVAGAVERWEGVTGTSFGHLDFVRLEATGELVLVDPGAFPQFTHWAEGRERVAELVLDVEEWKKKQFLV
ncbi:MAG: ATP-grasp domain-containing protein [Promethearchaeota archaeon]